jgi:type IV secretory pathway VirB4 component
MTTISTTEAKDLITFLFNAGVSNFTGFGLQLEFKADKSANPFAIQDAEERRQKVLESFKTMSKDEDADLYYSVAP